MSKARVSRAEANCPCGAGRPYADCCGRYIDHGGLPDTAEQLMRSRYSAFVFGREEYLLRTWHVSTRPVQLGLEKLQMSTWLGLRILRVEAGNAQDSAGIVEFVARYQVNGRAERLQEISRFIREAGTWYYVNGQPPDRRN